MSNCRSRSGSRADSYLSREFLWDTISGSCFFYRLSRFMPRKGVREEFMRMSMLISLCSRIVARACDVCTVASVALRAFLVRHPGRHAAARQGYPAYCASRREHHPWHLAFHQRPSSSYGLASRQWTQLLSKFAHCELAACPAYARAVRLTPES